jgi:mannose-1-phosphate guanylyltransferase/mannose-6-phosphate isomerase
MNATSLSPLIPVILSGGAGTRLWPVSREGNPKPFMKLADGQSLLAKTFQRAADAADCGFMVTVTNRDYYFLSKDEFEGAKLGARCRPVFLLEPAGRNTAPAVALAALQIAHSHGADALMLVLPADHLIQDQAAFKAAVEKAAALARQDYLVTFGITPTTPETGFGYIEGGDLLGESPADGRKVARFVEKPTLERAEEYLRSGNFLWNSGMFCFRAGTVLQEFATHAPEIDASVKVCWAAMATDHDAAMKEIPAAEFEAIAGISLDYALMERSSRVAVVPGDFGWNDIGSWSAVRDLVAADKDNNRGTGDVVFVDSHNTFIQSEDRLVATLGVDNLTIIDTPDALLVARTDKVQDVRKVVAELKSRGHEAFRLHRTVARPWGTYTVLEDGDRFKIKRIMVKPGASLSLQLHHHRSEHWIVVHGMARVVNGERELYLRTNESTYIPAGHRHRLENPGLLDLMMIEVQSGEYLGEDDIVRFEDIYGRA